MPKMQKPQNRSSKGKEKMNPRKKMSKHLPRQTISVKNASFVESSTHFPRLRNIKVCSNCGKETEFAARTCPYCDGSVITKVVVEKQ